MYLFDSTVLWLPYLLRDMPLLAMQRDALSLISTCASITVCGASVVMMLFRHYQPSVNGSAVKSEMELRLHKYNLMLYVHSIQLGLMCMLCIDCGSTSPCFCFTLSFNLSMSSCILFDLAMHI